MCACRWLDHMQGSVNEPLVDRAQQEGAVMPGRCCAALPFTKQTRCSMMCRPDTGHAQSCRVVR